MQPEQRLIANIRKAVGPSPMTVYQGIVASIEGITCTVTFGSMNVSGIRLRASKAESSSQILFVPRIGSAVIVCSLSGDMSDLAVISVDEVERIEVNGGQLCGLINIDQLTEKINALVDAFNSHTHLIPAGAVVCEEPNAAPVQVPRILSPAPSFRSGDYEDETIKH